VGAAQQPGHQGELEAIDQIKGEQAGRQPGATEQHQPIHAAGRQLRQLTNIDHGEVLRVHQLKMLELG
jgi:hypothetical protein